VLRAINLELAEGDVLGIVGESGSGKTTLARILVGLHRADRGLVTLDGQLLSKPAVERPLSVRRNVQIIFQNPGNSLKRQLRVGQILRQRIALFERLSGAGLRERVAELLVAAAGPAKRVAYRGPLFGWNDDVDIPACGFGRGESEQPFGGRIPARDDALQRFGDDGVMGGFDGRAEQTLAHGEPFTRGFRAPMFAGFALKLQQVLADRSVLLHGRYSLGRVGGRPADGRGRRIIAGSRESENRAGPTAATR